jgi:hypothetical protein
MKIEFADERIKEYSQGMGFHLKNEGKPIDVSAANGSDLLDAKHSFDGGATFVNIFKAVGSVPKKVADAKAMESEYPAGFPHMKALTGAGFKHAEVVQFDRAQLMEINGIGEKAADAILEFVKE